jgi:regulator of nucleoside diphosphate kinase
MSDRIIHITEFDAKRIRELLDKMTKQQHSRELEMELDRAVVVPPKNIPADIITMNSTVRLLDLDTKENLTYTLVFPEQANINEGKISVLAPIGTAMIGYRVGDTFMWRVPDGERKFRVEAVLYQPEASGNYDL